MLCSVEKLNFLLLKGIEDKVLICTEYETNQRREDVGFKVTDQGRELLYGSTGSIQSSCSSSVKEGSLFKDKLRLAMTKERERRKENNWEIIESKSKPGKFFRFNSVTKESRWLN